MTENEKIANIIAQQLGGFEEAFKAAMLALEYKDKEIAKIKQALQSVVDEFSKMNIG